MQIMRSIGRAIDGLRPDKEKRLAKEKREMEKTLRAAGASRKEAMRLVANHFGRKSG